MAADAVAPGGVRSPGGRVVVFAPSPVLTITIEEHEADGDIHVHAGGQGVWQARMVRAMGAEVMLCASFAGETGRVLQHLIGDEGIPLLPVKREGRGATYIHDRREGRRKEIVETEGDPLARHELDQLYGVTLGEGIASSIVLLSGPCGDKTLSPEVYRRLAADLRTCQCRVIVDLAGDRLDAALRGGVDIAKVSDEELLADERISSTDVEEIASAMHRIRDAGADAVIVTRADQGLLLLTGEKVLQVLAPKMEIVDKRGAGDSFTAATVAALAQGSDLEEAVVVGAAAGALNVTRHGLGTGDPAAIRSFSRFVQISVLDEEPLAEVQISPAQLADFVKKE